MSKKSNKGFDFSAFLKNLQENEVKPVKVEVRQERKYFLIVTEGAKTEPLYFEEWERRFPRNQVKTVEVHGEGLETVRVVERAIELRDERRGKSGLPDFDEVWAVFDKDDTSPERFHKAIDLARKEGIEPGFSNQSFELWYVLHFEYLQSALHRNDYIDTLSQALGIKYRKNDRDVMLQIKEKGNLEQAIQRAAKLEELHKGSTPSDACPYTRVYVLVERIWSFLENRGCRY